jgi:hypothetical protein
LEEEYLCPLEVQLLKVWVSEDVQVWVEDVQRLWLVFGVIVVAAVVLVCFLGWSPTAEVSRLSLALGAQPVA